MRVWFAWFVRVVVSVAVVSAVLVASPDGGAAAIHEAHTDTVVTVRGQLESLGGEVWGPPQLSGDGRYLAFIEDPRGAARLIRLDLATGQSITVAGPGELYGPGISFDGSTISFKLRPPGATQFRVFVWTEASGAAIPVSPDGVALSPATASISNDGDKVGWYQPTATVSGCGGPATVWVRSSNSLRHMSACAGTSLAGDGRYAYIAHPIARTPLRWDLTTDQLSPSAGGRPSNDGSILVRTAMVPAGYDLIVNKEFAPDITLHVPNDLALPSPSVVLSGNGARVLIWTNAQLTPEAPLGYNAYLLDTGSGAVALVPGVTGPVVDVSDDGRWAISVQSGVDDYTISLIDLDPTPAAPPVDQLQRPQLTDQISRLYQAYFLRTPDGAGLDYWRMRRADGLPLSAISDAFAASAEFQARYGPLDNQAFVIQVYANVLQRPPDPAGLDHWTGQLDHGLSRGQMMIGFSESAEFIGRTSTSPPAPPPAAQIWRLYQAFFLRGADQQGLDYWYGQWTLGTDLTAIANSFAASTEFQARYGALDNAGFANLVYLNVLQRPPDHAGLQYWTGQLDRGLSRGQMMIGFSDSAEFILKTDTLPPS